VKPQKASLVKTRVSRKKKSGRATSAVRRKSQSLETVSLEPKGLGTRAGVGAGDLQDISVLENVNSESAEELLEERAGGSRLGSSAAWKMLRMRTSPKLPRMRFHKMMFPASMTIRTGRRSFGSESKFTNSKSSEHESDHRGTSRYCQEVSGYVARCDTEGMHGCVCKTR